MWLRFLQSAKSIMRPFTIAVEGNIGSGKTTFLKHFAATNKQILVAAEPVTQWQNVRGFNLLQLMYEDTEKWGFTFQTYVQLTMLQMHMLDSIKQPVKMMERSLHSARYCFVENLWREKLLGDEQQAVLDEWYQWLFQQGILDVDLIVYLRATPETVHKRLLERGREEEQAIPLSLLEKLHQLHDDWLLRGLFPIPAPVMVVDADKSIEELIEDYEKCDMRVREMVLRQQPANVA